jgi:hypothetical protein
MWAKASPYFDFKTAQKTKPSSYVETGGSLDIHGGNKTKITRQSVIDYQSVQMIETTTTRFAIPNRILLGEVHHSPKGDGKKGKKDGDENGDSDGPPSDPEGSIEVGHHPKHPDQDEPKEKHHGEGSEGGEEETAVTKSSMADHEGSESRDSDDDGAHGPRKLTAEQRRTRREAQEEQEMARFGQEPDPKILEAIEKAKGTQMYQTLTEKHRSQAAKEHMGLAAESPDGEGIMGQAENILEHPDMLFQTNPLVLGGSVWDWARGAGQGPCGK